MTTQMNSTAPTVVDEPRNPQTPQPHDDHESSPPPPKRRWFAPIGLAAFIGIAGVAILVDDANDRPGPTAPADRGSAVPNDGQTPEARRADGNGRSKGAPTNVETGTGLPRRPQDFEARVRADEVRGTRPQAGMPDGYWVANSPSTIDHSAATTADNGQVRLPGMPDGYWQWEGSASTTSAT